MRFFESLFFKISFLIKHKPLKFNTLNLQKKAPIFKNIFADFLKKSSPSLLRKQVYNKKKTTRRLFFYESNNNKGLKNSILENGYQ